MTTHATLPGRGDRRLRPRRPWVRGGAVVLGLVWVVLVFAAVLFFGVASAVGGWVYALVWVLPGLVAAARLAGVRRWRDTFVLATGVALLPSLGAYQVAPPGHDRIRAAAEDAGLHEVGWDRVAVDERGNTWCLQGCPEVTYFYAADLPAARAVDTLDAVLEQHGWSGGAADPSYGRSPSSYDPEALGTWDKGRWHAQARVPSQAQRSGWSEEVAARGLTPVEVTVSDGG